MSERSAAARWLLLALLVTGMFFCYAHRGTLSLAAPFMMKEFGFGTAVTGVLLSAFFWSYSLAQVPAGWIVDRYGVGRAYAAGFFVWTLAVILTGFVSTLSMLIVLRILMGAGQGVAFPVSARAVANWFPPSERGGATGAYISGNRLGQAAIAAIAPGLIAAYGWRWFFLIAGAAGTLWLLPWLVTMRWWTSPQVTQNSARPVSLRTLVRQRGMSGVFLGFFAFDYVWYVFLTWMPGYLMLERKFGASEMAIYSSVPFVVQSIAVLLAGMLGDLLVRHGWPEVQARKTLITVGLLIACFIVPAGFVADKLLSVWLLGLSICGLGIASPNTWALTQAITPKQVVASASGIQNLGGNLGGVVAPMLTGFVADATGSFAMAFVIAGVVLLFGIAAYWILIPADS